MSFLHLANTLHNMHSVHVNNLAYRKFGGLDSPLTLAPDEEATTIRLSELLDSSRNEQGSLTDLYTSLDTPPTFRDLKVQDLPLNL